MKTKPIILEDSPVIEGLVFRHFEGEADYHKMARIIEAASLEDHEDFAITVDDIRHDYSHLSHSNPATDMLFAELAGKTVAYCRVEWYQEEKPNDRIYQIVLHVMPEARDQGIDTAMLKWCEARLRTIAVGHPEDSARYFQHYTNAAKASFIQTLTSMGYEPARYSIQMSRTLENIPTAELPDGITTRPAREKDSLKIWDASMEAFRDHWGFSEPDEKDFESYHGSKYYQPERWQVAWDGDEVVSSVMNYIDHDYNQKFNRLRGWTEQISTRREWRRRGIAKALIVRSMHMHKAQGMTEVALGVDTKNPNGALQLYQSLGYKKEKSEVTFRKAL